MNNKICDFCILQDIYTTDATQVCETCHLNCCDDCAGDNYNLDHARVDRVWTSIINRECLAQGGDEMTEYLSHNGLQFHLEGTAGTFKLWKSWGRMTGTQWAMTDSENPDKIRTSPDRFNLKAMKGRAYKFPEGTPDRWTKVKS